MTNSKFKIIPATDADVGDLLRLVRGLAEYEKVPHEVTATEDDLREALFGERPYAEAVLARLENRRVGMAIFFHTYFTFSGRPGLYLEDLFVEPAHRGQGIGKQLLAHVAGIAVARRCRILGWSALDWNEPAIGFYRALGARQMDEWRMFRLTGDALVALAAGQDAQSSGEMSSA